jgi:hypothetical protein
MLARLALDAGDVAEARRWDERSVTLARELNDLHTLSVKLGRLAQLAMDSGEPGAALAFHRQRAGSSRLLGNPLRLAQALHDVAIAARLVGDMDGARQAFDESLQLCQTLRLPSDVARIIASLGHLHRQLGSRSEACERFKQALGGLTGRETELGIATALCGVGQLALDAGDLTDAARLLAASEALLERMQAGPYGLELKPSQIGPRRYQFHCDAIHVRELRTAGQAASKDIPTETLRCALAAGRALTTDEAVALALRRNQTYLTGRPK